jgi:hypothetical protein
MRGDCSAGNTLLGTGPRTDNGKERAQPVNCLTPPKFGLALYFVWSITRPHHGLEQIPFDFTHSLRG